MEAKRGAGARGWRWEEGGGIKGVCEWKGVGGDIVSSGSSISRSMSLIFASRREFKSFRWRLPILDSSYLYGKLLEDLSIPFSLAPGPI